MLHNIRWTSDKIRQRLRLIEPLVYRRRQPLSPFRYVELESPLADPPVAADIEDQAWLSLPWGSYWGQPNTDFVLRTQFSVPNDWDADAPVVLCLPLGQAGDFSHPEALVFVDGEPLAGCDRHHQEIVLPSGLCDGAGHTLALHGWTGGTQDLRFDPSSPAAPPSSPQLLMGTCEVIQVHTPTRDFVALARVALGVADRLDENVPARGHLYNALDRAFRVLDTREPFGERFYTSLPAAMKALQEGIARAGTPLEVDVTATGHAHIDVAWLWTLGQTRRKAGRTFHNVLRLMDEFPEFRFAQSQPQLYDYLRQDYPGLFEAIRQRVAEGRWEVLGGMWVEADCNLSGGESLARQFLLGRSFFAEHFGAGVESPVLWLPDVFGYACNLPQLIKGAGLDYFFTIKLGWSQYNRYPYDSFWWQGLDGTRVLTHFSSSREGDDAFAGTYNANASPATVLNTWTNFQQKDWSEAGVTPPLLMSYGYGDGGGGPTREMLENIRELASFPAMPRVKCGKVSDFFRDLEAKVGDHLPTWNGELYLEYHRGTYTTQARNKRANRKSEFLLHDAEFLAALAATLDPGYTYPHQDLRQAWQLVCLNQFHDILPGSSIGDVYEESLGQYAEVKALGEGVRDGALALIATAAGGDLLVANPTSFPLRELALWHSAESFPRALQRAEGDLVSVQVGEGYRILDVGELPPYSITPLYAAASPSSSDAQNLVSYLYVTENLLENDHIRVELDGNGDIIRIYDKANRREVLPPGATANQFQLFEDRPRVPDAWDIDIYYDDQMWPAEPADSVRVIEPGPLRAALEVRRRIEHSDVVQVISLAHNGPRLDFSTTVQWRERHMMLKVAFPVDVLSPVATYEIQWGNVERPTHRNTSWDWARFETCAQKWVDLSEGGYGASLLNDCKYGHDIRDNVIRLTLLRSPTDPDPKADLGEHRFSYSFFPHAGSWDESTLAQAYALNDPLIVWPVSQGQPTDDGRSRSQSPVAESRPAHRPPPHVHRRGYSGASSLVAVDLPNVIIETIKQAEDGNGLILRLYESQRERGEFTLTTSFPLAGAWRTNLLEEDQEWLATDERGLRHFIKPYQILTLRLLPAPVSGEAARR